jgi:hypothetical protein
MKMKMKKQMTGLKGFLQFATVLSVVGFCSIAQAQVVVNLEVNPNQDKLIVTTRGSCANQPNTNGCVRASGRIQINLNLTGDTSCSEAAGARWELDHVALGNSDGGQPGNISSVAAGDFNANQGSGIVTPVSNSARHILIRDDNSEAYDIYYTVFANCVGGSSTIDSDPRVENDGTGLH